MLYSESVFWHNLIWTENIFNNEFKDLMQIEIQSTLNICNYGSKRNGFNTFTPGLIKGIIVTRLNSIRNVHYFHLIYVNWKHIKYHCSKHFLKRQGCIYSQQLINNDVKKSPKTAQTSLSTKTFMATIYISPGMFK